MDDKLTVFYNKRTGSIKELCGGCQDMSWFGDEEEDYEQIFDYIIVDHDDYILQNFTNFHVVEEELKIKTVDIPDKYI